VTFWGPFVLHFPLRYRDPSGHQACEADDAACWERRWFQAHGYEFFGGEWIYTGNYVFADRLAFEEALADIVLGQHQVGNVASLSFVDGPLTYSLVQRGQDTILSKALGSVAFAMDIVDTAITGGVALAYTIEQIATAAIGGPPGAAVGYVIGEGVNKGTGAFLLVVDLTGLGFIGTADWAAGRTGVDFENRQAWIGLDTIASMTTLGTSAGGQILLPVAPGVYVALAGDVAQLIYDFAREARLPGYSLQVQWQ
jgi:hypothetical protein